MGAVGEPDYGFNGSRARVFLTMATGFGGNPFSSFYLFAFLIGRTEQNPLFSMRKILCALMRYCGIFSGEGDVFF